MMEFAKTAVMRLKCATCGRVGRYTVGRVYVDPDIQDHSDNAGEYLAFTAYFRCRGCKSAGPWELTADGVLALSAYMLSNMADARDERLTFAKCDLFDGSPFRSAAQAEEYLLGILEGDSRNSLVWNRLGNIYSQAGLVTKAAQAYKSALQISPDDLESRYSLAGILFDKGQYKQAAEQTRMIISAARENQDVPEEVLRNIIRHAIVLSAEIADRTDGEILAIPPLKPNDLPDAEESRVYLTRYDLSDESDWEVLIDDVLGKKRKHDAPLKPLLTQAAKVGRNSPCPCGSGKKYKKCCGG
jgi:tetratricopeptide (TPR) repeat protein